MGDPMAVFLGLLVTLSYGAGDFYGGLSSRRLTPVTVVQMSQMAGLVAVTATLFLLPHQRFVGIDVARGALAGTVGLVGLVLLYRGLAAGAMSIIAPITAVGSAVLPVGWGLLNGERPSSVALVGVTLSLLAVLLVSSPAGDGERIPGRRRELALALVAGWAFGVVFILLGSSGPDSGLWPVFAARAASVTVMTVVLLARGRRPAIPPAGTRTTVAAAGVLDVAANAIFVVAARAGLLSLTAAIGALYPATTVVLARVVLHERVERRQQVGLACALAGVLLIAA
jgi:drug/metabolite transporter (DMT)-like permease